MSGDGFIPDDDADDGFVPDEPEEPSRVHVTEMPVQRIDGDPTPAKDAMRAWATGAAQVDMAQAERDCGTEKPS